MAESRQVNVEGETGGLPRISPFLLRLFYLYCRRYIRRHLHALRIAKGEIFPEDTGPLVIYLNHPSWWDPLICLALARRFYPKRSHYAPIDAGELNRYRFFKKLGFFGIEAGTFRGAARFLKTAELILKSPEGTLWLTPEGEFRDPRQRPSRLAPGLGHLACRMETGMLLPLALEFPFWEERNPEALAAVGEAIDAARFRGIAAGRATELLGEALEKVQDRLARLARERSPENFKIVLGGSAGVGGVYDLWRRIRSTTTGETFRTEHGKGGR